jgi:carboxyl-terminal processing protease
MKKNSFLAILSFILICGCEKALLGPGTENNTPIGNFNALWKTLDEKYGQFTVKEVDWDSLYNYYRAQISPATTENELWDIFSKLLTPLNDAHITLFNRDYSSWYTPWNIDFERKKEFDAGLIKNKYLSDPKTAGEGVLTYGKIKNDNIGYIYISTFGPVSNGKNWVTDIDRVLEELSSSDGLIIDVRNNGGGFLVNVLYIASAFVDKKITYFFIRKKNGPGHNEFGEPVAKIVVPRFDEPLYKEKIILLTNRFSSSGSEATAQIFKNIPNAIQIGDTTTGALGEVTHVAQLPNGWTLNYPCTLTLTPDGNCLEGIGIPPVIHVENTREDIAAGIDKVLDRAISYLTEN